MRDFTTSATVWPYNRHIDKPMSFPEPFLRLFVGEQLMLYRGKNNNDKNLTAEPRKVYNT